MTALSNPPTFSQAFQELQQILADSETKQLDLEKGIQQYRRACELSKFLKTELTRMEAEIETINLDQT